MKLIKNLFKNSLLSIVVGVVLIYLAISIALYLGIEAKSPPKIVSISLLMLLIAGFITTFTGMHYFEFWKQALILAFVLFSSFILMFVIVTNFTTFERFQLAFELSAILMALLFSPLYLYYVYLSYKSGEFKKISKLLVIILLVPIILIGYYLFRILK